MTNLINPLSAIIQAASQLPETGIAAAGLLSGTISTVYIGDDTDKSAMGVSHFGK
jgi:hypothetical protein